MKPNIKIRCMAIDDEPIALEKISTYIGKVPFFELVAACESPSAALDILNNEVVDVIFVDINMPDINGLDLVRSLAYSPMVVFTTAYAEYAIEGYKVRAIDYLLKPFDFKDFERTSENLKRQWQLLHSAHSESAVNRELLYLKVDYRYVKVDIDNIVLIEGMNEYLKIHLAKGEPLLTHTTFKQILGSLPGHFLQVHRSYVVNMKHVVEVERSIVLMSNGMHISVSESNKDNFLAWIRDHSLKK